MLARRAAAEIRVDDQQARIASRRVVERVLGAAARRFAAIVFEDVFLETIEGDGLQKPRRDDAIGVDVVAAQDERRAGDGGNARRAHAGTASVRTSTTSPAIAAAATIAGLISSVRPVGLPCRPLKLRLDDDAQISRPSRRSGFMARHIEQPASAPFEAGRAEDLVEPLALGRGTNGLRSRHHQRPDVRRDVMARGDPGGLAQVRQPPVGARPDERDVDPRPGDRLAAVNPMNSSASVTLGRSAGARSPGRGNRASTATDWPGLMPQVTVGAIPAASIRTIVVPSRVGIGRQRLPPGARAIERLALRRESPAAQELDGRLVGIDVADARAALDGHVADRHPLVHRHAVEIASPAYS